MAFWERGNERGRRCWENNETTLYGTMAENILVIYLFQVTDQQVDTNANCERQTIM